MARSWPWGSQIVVKKKKKKKTQFTFTDKKLNTQFNVKDMTKYEHKNDVVYFGKCPEQNCTDNYLGESAGRISEHIIDHSRSYLFSYVIRSGFRKYTFKKRLLKPYALFIN